MRQKSREHAPSQLWAGAAAKGLLRICWDLSMLALCFKYTQKEKCLSMDLKCRKPAWGFLPNTRTIKDGPSLKWTSEWHQAQPGRNSKNVHLQICQSVAGKLPWKVQTLELCQMHVWGKKLGTSEASWDLQCRVGSCCERHLHSSEHVWFSQQQHGMKGKDELTGKLVNYAEGTTVRESQICKCGI
jgi:hypothetical protein